MIVLKILELEAPSIFAASLESEGRASQESERLFIIIGKL